MNMVRVGFKILNFAHIIMCSPLLSMISIHYSMLRSSPPQNVTILSISCAVHHSVHCVIISISLIMSRAYANCVITLLSGTQCALYIVTMTLIIAIGILLIVLEYVGYFIAVNHYIKREG